MDLTRSSALARIPALLAIGLLVVACGGGGGTTPTPTPAASSAPSDVPSAGPSQSDGATGPANIEAVAEIEAGAPVEIAWTGPNGRGDYITIVAAGATEWTNEAYFDTDAQPSPRTLTAPTGEGSYEIWYVAADGTILDRHDLTVTPFEGDLLAVDSVVANTKFEVAWNGPDGNGDYLTIVPKGATQWTNESYAYTRDGNPVELLAPGAAGEYEIWYVTGDGLTQSRRPIEVTAADVALEGPEEAAAGSSVEISWTGPNGVGDYITFAPVGSPEGTYLGYTYTTAGSPLTVTAPTEPGDYEIRYVSGTDATLKAIPIEITG